mmetsp:Transcript_22409/g.43568  ORF Transcript_22409/g.43568 Transcript_22409/m.43568 type:complete len:107 (+) Transcript_22409:2043-2363(+)
MADSSSQDKAKRRQEWNCRQHKKWVAAPTCGFPRASRLYISLKWDSSPKLPVIPERCSSYPVGSPAASTFLARAATNSTHLYNYRPIEFAKYPANGNSPAAAIWTE